MDFSGRGLVYDSAFNSFASLEKAVKLAKEAGMTDIQVVAVHNDAIAAFSNTVNRGVCTGRFLSLDYFTEEKMMVKERFELMIDEVRTTQLTMCDEWKPKTARKWQSCKIINRNRGLVFCKFYLQKKCAKLFLVLNIYL